MAPKEHGQSTTDVRKGYLPFNATTHTTRTPHPYPPWEPIWTNQLLLSHTYSRLEPRYQLDPSSLEPYLQKSIPGFAVPVKVSQFKLGQSNPTYLLTDAKYVPQDLLLWFAECLANRFSISSEAFYWFGSLDM